MCTLGIITLLFSNNNNRCPLLDICSGLGPVLGAPCDSPLTAWQCSEKAFCRSQNLSPLFVVIAQIAAVSLASSPHYVCNIENPRGHKNVPAWNLSCVSPGSQTPKVAYNTEHGVLALSF